MNESGQSPLIEPLTEREEDVLALLVQGKTNREIAEELVLSVNTVKWYNREIYGKLGVENREEAAEKARELGMAGAVREESLPQHILPVRLNKFIGRKKEIDQLKEWFPNHRLITLVGAGGIGKTRLSLEIARTQLTNFPDGVWFVELASIADPALVPQAVASVLHVQETSGESKLAILEEYLHDKRILLVLDNCEHVIDAAAELAEWLLQKCLRLKLMATSREALNIPGETIFRVPSLSLPGTVGSWPDASEAAQLFIERAATNFPGFQVTDENAQSVAKICQRLDGIPLAIELAASKVNVMTVEQIASRLDDVFQILTGGSRTALPRHQTLRATIDWGYRLLSEPEQRLLRWLSVFAGDWTLETAEDICANEKTPKPDILNLLTQLVNKSLVVVDRNQDDGIRYNLLETIRQYAREKLAEQDETHAAHNAHSQWFLNYAEKAAEHLLDAEQLEWLRRLDTEHDNFRAAITWSIEQEDAPSALRLAGALSEFWFMHSYWREGIRWCAAVLALKKDDLDENALVGRGRVLLGNVKLVIIQGLHDFDSIYDELINQCNEALNIFQNLDDDHNVIHALHAIGSLNLFKRDLLNAHLLFERSLALSREINNLLGISENLCMLALLTLVEKDPVNAKTFMEQGLDVKREIGETFYFSSKLFMLGQAWFRQEGDIAQAKTLFQESINLLEKSDMRRNLNTNLRKLTWVLLWEGEFKTAEGLLRRALSIAKKLGRRRTLGLTLLYFGNLTYRKGDLAEARSRYEQSLELFKAANDQPNIGWARICIGKVLCCTGEVEQAAEMLHQGHPLVELGGDIWDRKDTLFALAHLARLQGDFEKAAATHERALTEIRTIPFWPANLEGLAYLAVLQDQFENAAWLMAVAQSFREQLGIPLPPVFEADYERNLSLIQDNLDGKRFATVWEDGRKLTVDDGRYYFTPENWPEFIKQLPNQ